MAALSDAQREPEWRLLADSRHLALRMPEGRSGLIGNETDFRFGDAKGDTAARSIMCIAALDVLFGCVGGFER